MKKNIFIVLAWNYENKQSDWQSFKIIVKFLASKT